MDTGVNVRRRASLSLLLLAGALAACSAGGPPASRASTGTSCVGQAYVEVRNDLPAAVDVYGYVGSTPMFLGTVSTGVQRLPLFQPTGYIYASRNGRRVSSSRGATPVVFTRGCERS